MGLLEVVYDSLGDRKTNFLDVFATFFSFGGGFGVWWGGCVGGGEWWNKYITLVFLFIDLACKFRIVNKCSYVREPAFA